jgi:hypothetical protein
LAIILASSLKWLDEGVVREQALWPFGAPEVVSKPGLAPDAQKQFLQIQQLQGCLSRL